MSAAEGEALVIVRDITDRKHAEAERERLERQLEQIRRMESIGQLAGGIAHDFNNMLTVVLGNVDLMKMQMGASHALEQEVAAIEQAALRSKEMARQLLAFSRQQIISPWCSTSTRRSPPRTRCSRRSSASRSRWTSGPPPGCGRCCAIRRRSIRCC